MAHFERADALERAYAEAEDVPSYVDWHHLHNLHLYGMALVHEGRLDDAGAVLREAFETPGQNAIPEVFGHIPYLEYLLHAGRYVEALARANELAETHGPTGDVIGRVFASEALLSLNRTDEAAAVGAEVASLAASLGDRISGPNAAFAVRQARSFDAQVDGELMLHSPDPTMLYTAERRLLPVADALIRSTGFDGWGEGLFRLVRMGRFAQRAGHTALVVEIRERIRKLDPVYDPDFEMPAAVSPQD